MYPQTEPPKAGLSPRQKEREAEKVEGLLRSASAVERDNPRLVCGHFEAKLPKSLDQGFQNAPSILLAFREKQEVVRVPDVFHRSRRLLLDALLGPKVERVMKVHVRQDGRDQASLRRALVAVRKLRALHHARFQKPRDVAKEVGVTDVVLEKHHQDLVIDVVEESFDVRFHNPLEVPKHHLLVDESDRVVRASARPELLGDT